MTMSNHGEDWGSLVAAVDYIKKQVECLPNLCQNVARHDEQIKYLKWLVGIVVVTLLGVGIKAIAQ